MRVLLSCRTLDNMAGGVERQIIGLANEMTRRGHEVALLTWDTEDAQAFYPIAPKVTWYKLGIGDLKYKAGLGLRLKRMTRIRAMVKDFTPDVMVAFQHGTFLSLKLYTAGLGIPLIASIRNAPSIFDFTAAGKQKNFINQTLRLADKITVQFDSYRTGFPRVLHDKMVEVPNAIEQASVYAKSDTPREGRWILLAVGRMSFQKNFHLLIQAFALLADEFPDWDLLIAGEGELREDLERLVEDLHKEKRIHMPGTISAIHDTYINAHLFCMPSLWEGFPNALSEALAHGLPALGFQQCEGVNTLIRDQENGLLVPFTRTDDEDTRALEQGLRALMQSPERRKAMGQKAIDTMKDYRPALVFDIWEKVLKETAR